MSRKPHIDVNITGAASLSAHLIPQLSRGTPRASQLQLLRQQVVQRLPGAFLLVVSLQEGAVHLV